MISYQIDVADVTAHVFAVRLTVPAPHSTSVLRLPVWIPGSYLVREFARHISRVHARQGTRDCAVVALDKTTWQVSCHGSRALEVSYEVYAFDPSVRTAFLDDVRGFFNASSVFMSVDGREAEPHRVVVGKLPKGWRVATAMAPAPQPPRHTWEAPSYDELADHPFELGAFWRGEFEAGGVPHAFVVAGAWPTFDGERLLAHAQRICAEQIRLWHGKGAPPMDRYVFMLNAVEQGYGGLEHRASTALIAPRKGLPRLGEDTQSDDYVALLGLISHEYFHTWNVKRLKPAEFMRYDLRRENYTELLWFFEGFTSYYDDLMLRRAGLIDPVRYLLLLARTINSVAATPGQRVQSVAEASFDAWTKYYRADENTLNATVSYYTKGSLVALLLDLQLRQRKSSLDALMRRLWQRCGGGALTEDDVMQEVAALGDAELAAALHTWVHGREPLPLAPALKACGVHTIATPGPWAAALGLKFKDGPELRVASVARGSAAHAAGLSAGDEVLAVNGWRLRKWDDALAIAEDDTPLVLLLAREQRIMQVALVPRRDDAHIALALVTQPTASVRAMRRAWMGA